MPKELTNLAVTFFGLPDGPINECKLDLLEATLTESLTWTAEPFKLDIKNGTNSHSLEIRTSETSAQNRPHIDGSSKILITKNSNNKLPTTLLGRWTDSKNGDDWVFQASKIIHSGNIIYVVLEAGTITLDDKELPYFIRVDAPNTGVPRPAFYCVYSLPKNGTTHSISCESSSSPREDVLKKVFTDVVSNKNTTLFIFNKE